MDQESRIFLNDDGNKTCKEGDLAHLINCMSCREYVIIKSIYENQNVVCPFCKNKFKIRIYKNGRVDVAIREGKNA